VGDWEHGSKWYSACLKSTNLRERERERERENTTLSLRHTGKAMRYHGEKMTVYKPQSTHQKPILLAP
jgi:hypothetical protein